MNNFKQLLDKKIEREASRYETDDICDTHSMAEQVGYKQGAALLSELLVECHETIERRMNSDDVCGHPFDENLGELFNKLEAFVIEGEK